MGRPTDNKKDSSIILRIDTDTKAFLERLAEEDSLTVSECVRKIINREKEMANNTSKISSLKTLRLRNETIEYFKGKPLNKVVDNLVEMIKEGKIELDGERIKVKGGLDGVPEELIADIELIGKFDNMTMGEILKELHFALDREDIMLVDKHFFYK